MKLLQSNFTVLIKKVTFLVLLVIGSVFVAYGQTYEWAKSIGGTTDDYAYSTAVDAAGNIYTTGSFTGTVDFDPGTGVTNLTSTASTRDIFISKLNSTGDFVWAKRIGSNADDIGIAITTDASGNVYITGSFFITVDFDPGAGVFNLTASGDLRTDIFIAKFNSNCDLIWAKNIGGTASDEGRSIAVDSSGNVYTTGFFDGTVDFDPGSGISNLTSSSQDIFISKLSSSGNFVWAKSIGGTSIDMGKSITVDSFGNVYSTGLFNGTVDFDPDAGVSNLTSTSSSDDIFISKLNSSGNFVWAKKMGSIGDEFGNSIVLDAFSNVYTTGFFYVACDFDPGAGVATLTSAGDRDVFISKLNSNGDFIWAKRIGGASTDFGYGIALDASGRVYTTGSFSATVDFDPGAGIKNINSTGLADIFISRLDVSGNYISAKKMGGTTADYGRSITIDAVGNIYTAGYFTGTADFDPGTGVANLTSAGLNDIFIHKMSFCTTSPSAISPVACGTYTSPSGKIWTTSGTRNDTIANAFGCDSVITINVTINPIPTVTVTSPTICSGLTASLTASGATSYTWTGGLSAISNPTTTILTTTTTYTVTGTALGCSATAVATVTIKPLPSVTVNSPTICSGQTATLSASGATNYTWTGGLSSTSNPTTPVLTTTTTFTVTGTASNGCSKTAIATVTVSPLPTVTVNSPTICSGQTASLLASGATSYTWTGGLSPVSNPTTPALTTTTTYTVTGTSGSCSNTAIATVTVTPLPLVTVSSTTICSGQTATLTASGATSYTWTGGLSAISNPTTPVLTTTTTYTVTGTTGSCSKTALATVTVTPLPTVTVSSPSICSGQTASLSASGATSYTWTGGLSAVSNPTTPVLTTTTTYTVTGTTGSCSNTAVSTVTVLSALNVTVNSPTICSGQTASLSASGATSYTWTGGLTSVSNPTTPVLTTTTTYTVTGTSGTCSNTAIATVTVTPLPLVTVSSTTICSGQTATLTASAATSYTWTGGLSAISNPTTPVLTTTTTYTVTGTSGSCSKTAVATVTVTPLPTVTVSSPGICSGQTATLSASGATSYTWTGGLSAVSNPTTPVLTTTTTYTVTGTTGSCSNTAVSTVTVLSALNVTVNSPTICSGQTASLSASGATSYTWTGGLTSVSNPTTPVLTTTTTYTVTGTSGSCSNTAIATVTVTPLPSVTVSSPVICSGQTASLLASGATSYTWTGGLSAISNPITPVLTTTTTYTVTGTTGSCSKTSVATVTAKPVPVTSTITQEHDTLFSSTEVSGASYEWYLGTTLHATTLTPFLKLTISGSYTVRVLKDGCSSIASASFAATVVGVRNSNNYIRALKIYPNPTDGRFVMSLDLSKMASVQINIFTLEGRALYSKEFTNTRNLFEEINMHGYEIGIYIIKLQVDEEIYYHKVVKQ